MSAAASRTASGSATPASVSRANSRRVYIDSSITNSPECNRLPTLTEAATFESPIDLSVVGFDDIRFAQHTVPPLTTIARRGRLARGRCVCCCGFCPTRIPRSPPIVAARTGRAGQHYPAAASPASEAVSALTVRFSSRSRHTRIRGRAQPDDWHDPTCGLGVSRRDRNGAGKKYRRLKEIGAAPIGYLNGGLPVLARQRPPGLSHSHAYLGPRRCRSHDGCTHGAHHR